MGMPVLYIIVHFTLANFILVNVACGRACYNLDNSISFDCVHPSQIMATIDTSVIESYRRLMGDETDPFIVKLIGTFLVNSLRLVGDIEEAAQLGDISKVVQAAHTLKSSSAIVGANQLMALSLNLEQSGREGRTEGMQDTVAQLTVEYGHVRQALEDLQRTMS